MPDLVETMFYVRETPWHNLGVRVEEALNSEEALQAASLDWEVIQNPIRSEAGFPIHGYKANIRNTDNRILGVVTDRYKVVQNKEAFQFTDELLGEGVVYETAGSLQEGRKVWMLARLPQKYQLAGDEVTPYLVFSNSHDGAGGIKVALTPIRVVCQNTLNLALSGAKRSWSAIHAGNINSKLDEAKTTLLLSEFYLVKLATEAENLSNVKVSDKQLLEYIEQLLPFPNEPSQLQVNNIKILRHNLRQCFYDAPDLRGMSNNAWRFINAVSDFATHSKPLRQTANYKESLFARTIDGNPLIDKAYELIKNT